MLHVLQNISYNFFQAILSLIHTIAKHRSFEHRDDATTTFDRDIKLIEKIIQNELTL